MAHRRSNYLATGQLSRDELAQLDVELDAEPVSNVYNREDLDRLNAWWTEFTDKAVSIPVSANANRKLAGGLRQDPAVDHSAILVDPRALNECLHQLGAKVTLRWRTEDTGKKRTYVSRKGKRQPLPSVKHIIDKGQFQLGQQRGKLQCYVTNTMRGLVALREEGP